MACLSSHLATKIHACLPSSSNTNANTISPSLPSTADPNLPIPSHKPNSKSKTTTLRRKPRRQSRLQQQLTLIRIERAVGAGSYRDSEPTKDSDRRDSIFKGLLPNADGALEGPVERNLRETGEWLANKSEAQFRLNGKRILMFVFQLILPTYILLFLVASGVIKLPFSTPLLDDLIM